MSVAVTRESGRLVVTDPRRKQLAELRGKVTPQYRELVDTLIQEHRPGKPVTDKGAQK